MSQSNVSALIARATLISAALLSNVGLAGGAAGTPASLNIAELNQFIAQEMKAADVPGLGLAIVENGKISYVHGYGVKNAQTRQPIGPNTQFAIASVTKSFTALGVMKLVDEGRINLDAPLTIYLPKFKLKDPAATAKVTVRHLLSHTTGLIRDDSDIGHPDITVAQILDSVAKTPLNGQPGEKFEYSNANAFMAGMVIERVTGQSWASYMQKEVLRPLGMNKANFARAAMKQTGDFADPNFYDVLTGLQPTAFYTLGKNQAPAGAINASAAEMARYAQYQLGSGAPLLMPQSLSAMHAQAIPAEGSTIGSIVGQISSAAAKAGDVTLPPSPMSNTGYGFFWGTETFLGQPVVEHGGNSDGFTANVTLLPSVRSGIVLLANSEHADNFIEKVRWYVMQKLLAAKFPQARSAKDADAVWDAQLKLLGQDNATRRAGIQAARNYQPKAGEFDALTGEYASMTGGSPTQVTRSGGRFLTLNSELQGTPLSLTLIPMGNGRFLSNSQPAVGAPIQFVVQGGRQMVLLDSPLGSFPFGSRTTPAK